MRHESIKDARRVRIWLSLAALVLVAAGGCAPAPVQRGRAPIAAGAPRARNVILMISDGAGFNAFDAASYYQHGHLGGQVYDAWPVALACATHPRPAGVGDGLYDPAEFWTDFNRAIAGKSTDSAGAATALYTGQKTYYGAVSVNDDHEALTTIAERADAAGLRAGAVTSVQLSHATPACLAAHNRSRGHYAAIAREMIYGRTLDVLIGGGHPEYDHNAQPVADDQRDAHYVGGTDTWEALKAGTTGKGWTLIDSADDFVRIATGDGRAPRRLLGVPRCRKTLQYDRNGEQTGALNAGVPDLATLTTAALRTLSRPRADGREGPGFVLMVEGGAVDWANHGNNLGRMIEEQADFNRAVEAVAAWVGQHSSWSDTLVIVTSDHECGGLWGPEAGAPLHFQPVVNRGAGQMPGAAYFSGGHTNALVPVYARGPGAALLRRCVRGDDPVYGPYIDNTDIHAVMDAVLPDPAPRDAEASRAPAAAGAHP
ncbi:MAG: alkaline phosphatase [Phycisphaerae bacterium]|nr:alkaline phosphatase [Phycisphaerae bacterium]